ncbi:MAG: HDIG domain-containing protein [Actinomycetota bacterium]|nr:HDIG domain-containing protein [Actinomycetota bacterium]
MGALWRRVGKRQPLLISLLLLCVVVSVLVLEYVPRSFRFEVGKPSTETVISPRSFEVEDAAETERARENERRRIADLFINPQAQAQALEELEGFLDLSRSVAREGGAISAQVETLRQRGGKDLGEDTLRTILSLDEEEAASFYTAVANQLASAMEKPVAPDALQEAREEIRSGKESTHLGGVASQAAAELAAALLRTNTPYSRAVIERDMEAAANGVPPVTVRFETGQRIVGKGDIITPLILEALNEAGALSPVGTYQQVLGMTLMVLFLYAMSLYFFAVFQRDIAADWRLAATVCLVFLVFFALARIFAVFADENQIWGYLVPLALVGMLSAILFDRLTSLFLVGVGSVVTALVLKGNLNLTVAAMLGGMAGMMLVRGVRTREDLMRAAAEVSLATAAAAMITSAMTRELRVLPLAGLAGLGNGTLSGLLVLGSIPVLERLSGMVTPMHLLELASPDQPLMKELISKAPGTYSHSVVVGNLAAAAAQEIGADALLARVGAYYHDIGKIKRSAFFVENQPRGFNGHDRIKPNLSALVISSHVREGVELARKHRLPREIIDIIRQHHGTTLIRYFYARALEEGTEGVSESRFRYPGERPRSKEAALVMLADAVEASAKALGKPSAVKLEQAARDIIEERLRDGQLAESNLTLGDLERIALAFTRILSGMYHERVEYPVLVKREGAF